MWKLVNFFKLLLSPLWLISTTMFNQMETNEIGMLCHVVYTAHLLICSLTLSKLDPSSYSCMLLALHTHHLALLNVYTAKLPHAITLYLTSCSPICLHSTSPHLLPLATYTTPPSAPSCYLHYTTSSAPS